MREVSSIEEYISLVKPFYDAEGSGGFERAYYRGQADSNYRLIPSLSHKLDGYTEDYENYTAFENEIIERSKLEYPDFFRETNSIDELALMQHYGLPTRLMDVTENPLVALFFACKGKDNMDGEVFIFNSGLYARNYTSYDEKIIKKYSKVAFVRTKIFSNRQRIQQGLFMWFPDSKLSGISKKSKVVSKIIKIPASNKEKLLYELKMVGISDKTLFPDNLDIACRELVLEITKDAFSC